eukprot:1750529-Amphidinium_carterae.2
MAINCSSRVAMTLLWAAKLKKWWSAVDEQMLQGAFKKYWSKRLDRRPTIGSGIVTDQEKYGGIIFNIRYSYRYRKIV